MECIPLRQRFWKIRSVFHQLTEIFGIASGGGRLISVGIFRPKFAVPSLTNWFFALIREFGKRMKKNKSHSYWLARFNRKMSFPRVFPLICDQSVWHNQKSCWLSEIYFTCSINCDFKIEGSKDCFYVCCPILLVMRFIVSERVQMIQRFGALLLFSRSRNVPWGKCSVIGSASYFNLIPHPLLLPLSYFFLVGCGRSLARSNAKRESYRRVSFSTNQHGQGKAFRNNMMKFVKWHVN